MTSGAQAISGIDAVRGLDDQIEQAAVKGDAETLSRIFADDMVFMHGNGNTDSKESWIARCQNPATGSKSRTLSDHQVEMHGDVAITSGRLDIVDLKDQSRALRFVRVYKLTPAGWRMLGHRTSRPV